LLQVKVQSHATFSGSIFILLIRYFSLPGSNTNCTCEEKQARLAGLEPDVTVVNEKQSENARRKILQKAIIKRSPYETHTYKQCTLSWAVLVKGGAEWLGAVIAD
jgi:hypothetical protein